MIQKILSKVRFLFFICFAPWGLQFSFMEFLYAELPISRHLSSLGDAKIYINFIYPYDLITNCKDAWNLSFLLRQSKCFEILKLNVGCYCCAKRSLRPSARSKPRVPSVRSLSVRPFVRIFGDFCEADMRGGHMLHNSEVLKHRFQNFLQKSGQSVNILGK